MIDGTRSRDWSPNWGVGVFFIACSVAGVARSSLRHGQWLFACALLVGMCVGCVVVLGHLPSSSRRRWGAFAVPVSVALVVADVLTPEESSGWVAYYAAFFAAFLAMYVPLDLWFARCDRRRLAP